jgi:hypothetical protein
MVRRTRLCIAEWYCPERHGANNETSLPSDWTNRIGTQGIAAAPRIPYNQRSLFAGFVRIPSEFEGCLRDE